LTIGDWATDCRFQRSIGQMRVDRRMRLNRQIPNHANKSPNRKSPINTESTITDQNSTMFFIGVC
jgi:hypothetical protein